MKQNLLFTAIAAVAVMTGCSKNEVYDNKVVGEQDKMEFTPVVGKQTRAVEIGSTDLQVRGTTLSLYGYKTDKLFDKRNDADATFASFFSAVPEQLKFDGYWSTATDYTWTALATNNLSIFTYYSPKGGLAGITAPTKTTAANFTYTVANDMTNQEDLLVATHVNMTKQNTNGVIAINFKHALSQLYFRAKLTTAGHKAVIKSIKVLSAANGGTFTYAETTGSVGVWGATPTGTINYIYADAISQEVASKDTPVRIGDAQKGSLMLMPQPVKAGTFQFEVMYDVYGGDGKLIGSRIVKKADMAALEMGKKYVYTLVLSASENDNIAFDVTVSEWDDTTVATEREVRFDDYKLTVTAADDVTAITGLITNYTPSVIYLQEVKIIGDLAGSLTIDLSGLRTANIPSGCKVILDCTAIGSWNSNSITVTAPTGWTVTDSGLSAGGKITVTKD